MQAKGDSALKVNILPYIAPKSTASKSAKNRNTRQLKIKSEVEKQKNALMFTESKPDHDDFLVEMIGKEDEIRNNGVINRNIHSIGKRKRYTK